MMLTLLSKLTKHLYFELPEKTTVAFKGTKEININTYMNDKKRVSVILAIACNEYKLSPLLKFKGGKGKKLEGKLNKLEFCKKKIIYKMSSKFLV